MPPRCFLYALLNHFAKKSKNPAAIVRRITGKILLNYFLHIRIKRSEMTVQNIHISNALGNTKLKQIVNNNYISKKGALALLHTLYKNL